MKKLSPFILLICSISAIAQDEGTIVKRERIQRDKNIFVGGGISLAPSLDDYPLGINFEGGFSKRLNRILSIGGSVSYLKFKFDQNITSSSKIDPTNVSTYPSNFYYDATTIASNAGILINISGGDLSVISLAANIKLNLVPIKENTKISVYGFAKPFVAKATTSGGNLNPTGAVYDPSTQKLLTFPLTIPSTVRTSFDEESVTTGGIFVGPGIEILPNNPISFFVQASFGYTFPIDQGSSLKSLSKNLSQWPAEIPVKSTGFTSINFAAGISFNLD